MHLFYHPDLSGDLVTVTPEESRHISVLRLKPGESIYLTDGNGLLCKALIADSSTRACQLQIMERHHEYQKKPYYLHIAIAPTKQMERFEWFLEKATEIGIDEITPVICRHAERRELKTERLQKILQSAIKQSLKSYLPRLNEPVEFVPFVKNTVTADKFIASGKSEDQFHIRNVLGQKKEVLILIGPEGDFSESELSLAMNCEFQQVNLGKSRLRTETAGIFVCAAAAMALS